MADLDLTVNGVSRSLINQLEHIEDTADAATGGGGSSIWAASVATIASLKARDISGDSAGDRIWVDGYHTGSPLGGGAFIVIDDAVSSDDEGYVIEPTVASGNLKYQRMGVVPGWADVTHFGAKGDASTNDRPAFQAAVDHLEARARTSDNTTSWGRYSAGFTLWIPPAPVGYFFNSLTGIDVPSTIPNVKIKGGGKIIQNKTDTYIFRLYSTDPEGVGFPVSTHRNILITDLTLVYLNGASSDIGAKHIVFDNAGTGSTLFGPGVIDGVCFYGGRRCISEMDGTDGYISNTTIINCLAQGSSGSFVSLYSDGASTGCVIRNNQTAIGNPIEATVRVKGAHDLVCADNAWESGSGNDTSDAAYFEIHDSHNVEFSGRMEWGPLLDGGAIFDVQNTQTTLIIKAFSITNCLVTAAETGTLVKASSGTVHVEGPITVFAMDINTTGRLNMCNNVSGNITWDAPIRFRSPEGTENHYLHADGSTDIGVGQSLMADYWFGKVGMTATGLLDALPDVEVPAALPQPATVTSITMPRAGEIYEFHSWIDELVTKGGSGYTMYTYINGAEVGSSLARTTGDGALYEASVKQFIQSGNAKFVAGDVLTIHVLVWGAPIPTDMDITAKVRVRWRA